MRLVRCGSADGAAGGGVEVVELVPVRAAVSSAEEEPTIARDQRIALDAWAEREQRYDVSRPKFVVVNLDPDPRQRSRKNAVSLTLNGSACVNGTRGAKSRATTFTGASPSCSQV